MSFESSIPEPDNIPWEDREELSIWSPSLCNEMECWDISEDKQESVRLLYELNENKIDDIMKASWLKASIRWVLNLNLHGAIKGEKINWTVFLNKNSEEENATVQSIFDQIMLDILWIEPWSLSDISQISETNMEWVEKIELITHPLFWIMVWDQLSEKEWIDSWANLDIYLENKILHLVWQINNTLKESPDFLPTAYVVVMDMIQELNAMQKKVPKGTLRIYNMPRNAFLTPIQRDIGQKILQKYWNVNDFLMDSYHNNTGQFTKIDINVLRNILPVNVKIELQWWYIGGCLDAAYYSVEKGVRLYGREDITIDIDYAPSTFLSPAILDDMRDQAPNLPQIKTSETIESLEDVSHWVASNSDFNNAFMQFQKPSHEQWLAELLDEGTSLF